MATPNELAGVHFVSTVAGLKKKARSLPAQRSTRSTADQRPRTGLTGTSGLIDDKGGADGPSADALSSYASRRYPRIPRPNTAGSKDWSLGLQPNGETVPSDLARRMRAARLDARMSHEELAAALGPNPEDTATGNAGPVVLSAEKVVAYESGEVFPPRSVLRRLAEVLEEPALGHMSARKWRKGETGDGASGGGAAGDAEGVLDRTFVGLDEAKEAAFEKLIAPRERFLKTATNERMRAQVQQELVKYQAELARVSPKQLAEDLQAGAGVSTLLAGRNRIGDAGARALAAALPGRLTEVDLSHNLIGSDGLAVLCEAAAAGSVATLRLSGNRVESAGGAIALHTLLTTSSALLELSLANCRLTAEAIKVVMRGSGEIAPAASSSVVVLDLHGNKLGDAGAALLAMGLKSGGLLGNVTTLELSSTGIADAGAVAVASALRDGCKLTALDLDCNRLTQDGATALAEVVSAKSQLVDLSLASNRLGANGGLAFARMLEQDGPGLLQKLNLSANELGSPGARGPEPSPPQAKLATAADTGRPLRRPVPRSGSAVAPVPEAVSPPMSPLVSPRMLAVPVKRAPCALVAMVAAMTEDDLRSSIEDRKRGRKGPRAARKARRAPLVAKERRQQQLAVHTVAQLRTMAVDMRLPGTLIQAARDSKGDDGIKAALIKLVAGGEAVARRANGAPRAAWGSSALLPTSTVAPHRLEERLAALRSSEAAGRALNNAPGPVVCGELPPSEDFITAMHRAMATGKLNALSIKIEGNGLGAHAHELLASVGVTFAGAGSIGLDLRPDAVSGGKNGILIADITPGGQASHLVSSSGLRVGMVMQSVAGVAVPASAGATAAGYQSVLAMIKAGDRPLAMTFVSPDESWHKRLDGWITTDIAAFPTSNELAAESKSQERWEKAIADGSKVDEGRVQQMRHELMARMPPHLGFITPRPAVAAHVVYEGPNWERKSLQQLRAKSRTEGTPMDPMLRAEAELIGSGLRSVAEIPAQFSGVIPEPHHGNGHRFVKEQTDAAAEMLLAGVNSTDLYPTQLAPTSFGKGQQGRFNLLEHRARQVAKQMVAVEVAAEVEAAGKGKAPKQPPTGRLKWRDPRTWELFNDRN